MLSNGSRYIHCSWKTSTWIIRKDFFCFDLLTSKFDWFRYFRVFIFLLKYSYLSILYHFFTYALLIHLFFKFSIDFISKLKWHLFLINPRLLLILPINGAHLLQNLKPNVEVHAYFAPATPPTSAQPTRRAICRCCTILWLSLISFTN